MQTRKIPGINRLATASTTNLNTMTKSQLLEVAAEKGLDGLTSRNTKAEIIEAIEGE